MAGQARGVTPFALYEHGAELHRGAALPMLNALESLYDKIGHNPGQRIAKLEGLASYLTSDGVIGSLVRQHLGEEARPVRCIAFDKTAKNNWALAWHQDRTICVSEQHNVAGFDPWTVKQGMNHVEPPFEWIESMLTLRIHLDHVHPENAPLKIALGSHNLGKIREGEIQ